MSALESCLGCVALLTLWCSQRDIDECLLGGSILRQEVRKWFDILPIELSEEVAHVMLVQNEVVGRDTSDGTVERFRIHVCDYA